MDISIISPFLNIKELQSNKFENNDGFSSIFKNLINTEPEIENKPSLNVKDVINQLNTDKSQENKNEDNEIINLFGCLASLNLTDFKAMSLNDESKDTKWSSETDLNKKEIVKNSFFGDKTKETENDKLYSLLSFNVLNGTLLQSQQSTNSLKSEILSSNLNDLQILDNFTNSQFNTVENTLTDSNKTILNLLQALQSTNNSGNFISNSNEIILKLSEMLKGEKLISDNNLNTIINNLISKIEEFLKPNENSININLEPPELGKIIFNFNSEKQLSEIKIISDYEEVKTFIQNNISKLEQELNKKGIEIKNLNIQKVEITKANSEKVTNNSEEGSQEEINNLFKKVYQPEISKSQNGEISTKDYKEFFTLLEKANSNEKSNTKPLVNYLFGSDFKSEAISDKAKVDTENNLPAQKIIDSVIGKIKQTIIENKTQIEVKLVPENLGKLTVKIVSEEGKLSANIEVKNIEVKQVIDSSIPKIKENLGQNGIYVDQINVSLSDDNYKQHQQEAFFSNKHRNNLESNIQNAEEEHTESMKTFGYNTLEYIV